MKISKISILSKISKINQINEINKKTLFQLYLEQHRNKRNTFDCNTKKKEMFVFYSIKKDFCFPLYKKEKIEQIEHLKKEIKSKKSDTIKKVIKVILKKRTILIDIVKMKRKKNTLSESYLLPYFKNTF